MIDMIANGLGQALFEDAIADIERQGFGTELPARLADLFETLCCHIAGIAKPVFMPPPKSNGADVFNPGLQNALLAWAKKYRPSYVFNDTTDKFSSDDPAYREPLKVIRLAASYCNYWQQRPNIAALPAPEEYEPSTLKFSVGRQLAL